VWNSLWCPDRPQGVIPHKQSYLLVGEEFIPLTSSQMAARVAPPMIISNRNPTTVEVNELIQL